MVKHRALISVCLVSLTVASSFVGCPVFAKDSVDIEIIEMVDDGNSNLNPWQDITGAMPGERYSAIPRIQNNGLLPVEVRVCVSESATTFSGETINLLAKAFEIEINEEWVEIINDNGMATNCYKYDRVIEAEEISEPLFYEVKLSSAIENTYQGATFDLHLDAVANDYDFAPVPDNPDAPNISNTPNAPDTGKNTASYFEVVSPVFFATMVLGVLAVMSILARKALKKTF